MRRWLLLISFLAAAWVLKTIYNLDGEATRRAYVAKSIDLEVSPAVQEAVVGEDVRLPLRLAGPVRRASAWADELFAPPVRNVSANTR